MQQMVQALQSEQAKRIDVKPGKKLMKKAAQEQAEARLVYINCNISMRCHHCELPTLFSQGGYVRK